MIDNIPIRDCLISNLYSMKDNNTEKKNLRQMLNQGTIIHNICLYKLEQIAHKQNITKHTVFFLSAFIKPNNIHPLFDIDISERVYIILHIFISFFCFLMLIR